MIGTKLKKGRARFEIVGADQGGWVVQRTDAHESPRRMTSADIAAEFPKADALPEHVQPNPADGWAALAQANGEAARRAATVERLLDEQPSAGTPEYAEWRKRLAAAAPAPPSPEDKFVRVSSEEARRVGADD